MSPGRLLSIAVLGILLSAAGYFSFELYRKHRAINGENKCGMTFMWRRIFLMPIPVPNNDVGRYSLLRYSEGTAFSPDFVGSSSDIPVLFVPGSGGSGAQVRSLASVMQNKTEMRRTPFRMHFYALDFDEEISALSGKTLIRQRDFLMKAIHVIREKYPLTNDKMILFGHSFGGVVIRGLPLHPDFKPNYMSLVLTLAAPLLQSPVVLDFPMANSYHELEEIWEDAQKRGIDHVRFFSFSGGEKDVLVPDRLVTITADHIIHLPSWSISGVAAPTDHLCILWCNQLVRYTSRILFDYGQKAVEGQQNPNLTLQVADEFLTKESKRLERMKNTIALDKDQKRTTLSETGTYQSDSNPNETAFRLDLPDELAYRIHVQCKDSRGYSCSEKLRVTILHPNGRRAFGEGGKLHGIRVKFVLLRPEQGVKSLRSYLILQAPESNVDYTITVEEDFFASWYMIVTGYASELMSSVIIGAILLVPVIEFFHISPSTVRLTLLAISTTGIAARFFHQDLIAVGILGILMLLEGVQPWLSLLFKKLRHRIVYLPLACLHPDLAIISVLLRSRKTQASFIYQLILLLSAVVVFPSIFEGGLPPKIDIPTHFYSLGANLSIANPAWLLLAAEFGGSKGILSKIVKLVAGYSCFTLLLSSLVFQQVPLHFYPSLLANVIYLTGF